MKKDSAVIDILSNPQLFTLFNALKTSNWRKLSEKNKKVFFEKLNRAVCISLKTPKLSLVVGDADLNEDNFLSTSDYANVIVDNDGDLIVNDVNYNQYLTVFEYLMKLRIHLLQLSYTGEYNGYFDDEKKNQISRNFEHADLGGVHLNIDKEDGQEYEEYQFINLEARKFAETILFEIVKNNFDASDCYDEEYFMSNYNVLIGEKVEEIGKTHIDSHVLHTKQMMYNLNKIIKKLDRLDQGELSKVSDKDLYFIVYPEIIADSDTNVVIKSFNEIINRIYGYNMKISWKKSDLVINNNHYSITEIENLLNIVLYECLNALDKDLREDSTVIEKEIKEKGLDEAIREYKKKWLFSVIATIDSSTDYQEFGVFKHQSAYRLLNKSMVSSIINKTSGNYFPLSKRGNK